MNFEQFVHEMEVCTKRKVRDDEEVSIQKVRKNNGVIYIGLSILKKNEAVAPIIYLEPYYQRYLLGISVEELSNLLVCQMEKASGKLSWDYREILDFQKIKHRIVYRLIHAEKNEELLKDSRARCEVTDEMLGMIDVLVDGEFKQELKNITLRFRGSENQRIIDVKKSLQTGETVLYY